MKSVLFGIEILSVEMLSTNLGFRVKIFKNSSSGFFEHGFFRQSRYSSAKSKAKLVQSETMLLPE